MPKFSSKSLERLQTCDSRLQEICHEAVKQMDFVVICGHRGEAEQNKAFQGGFSKLKFPDSKHNKLPSLAVDIAPCVVIAGKTVIDWDNISAFKKLGGIVKQIAKEKGYQISWGGDWKSFKDYPHFEIV